MSTTTVRQPAYRQRLGYHSMVLGGICAIVATLIIIGNHATHERIAHELEMDQRKMLSQVLPAELYNNNLLQDTKTLGSGDNATTVYVARLDGQAVGFAFPVVGYGYSGAIQLIMGVNSQGEILGVRVISHAETPGLGDKIDISKDNWITSFNNQSLTTKTDSQWKVKKDGGDFDQFTGATITPRAVVGAVYEGLRFFQSNKDTLMATDDPVASAAATSEE
ncbi:electron transport complex subunit RsxG [Halioxenophilus sp. WMMB6]|uniref:electron transport complex subunit RsxG n=1 Tax=Halioxenophilus sp. WMMB6 TaxID=3073815 RepID=UPI00295E6093|nr:electron transport complex subunit RsxG [Halioxenophilus sp. WMMB6]